MLNYFRVISALFDQRQRRRYYRLQAFLMFAAVVQVISVASIAPFIALISRPSLIHEQALSQRVFDAFGFRSDLEFLTAFGFFLMAVVVFSNVVPAVMTWMVWSFAKRLGAEFQALIFRGYMHGDLALLARVNSAQMVRTVVHGVNRLVYNVVQPLLTLMASLFVIALIAVALVLIQPVVAFSAGIVVGGGYWAVFQLTKRQLTRHGAISWEAAELKQRLLSEALGGLKELRLAGTAHLYEHRLDQVTDKSLSSEGMIGLYGELPRFVLEAVSMCALIGLGILMLHQRDNWAGIVAILSVYAMAGYRLLPAAQTLFRSASMIRSNLEAIDHLRGSLEAGRSATQRPREEPAITFPLDGLIEFRNVRFQYPETPTPVLQDLSFAIRRNAITAIVGSSGAGKSTVADLLMGLLPVGGGEIVVGGVDIDRAPAGWRHHVAYVSQSVFIIDDSIAANIAFGSLHDIDVARMKRAAQMANVAGFAEQLPEQYDYRVGEDGALLSGGQRQRIGIARALYNDADVIVLDEPTSALDAVTERDILSTLDRLAREKTIILITHRLSTLRSADQIIMLDTGRLTGTGSFEYMISTNDAFRGLVAAEAQNHAA